MITSLIEFAFTLKNTGGETATGTVSISGDPVFTIESGGGSFSLEPSGTKSIVVCFEPLEEKSYTGTLSAIGDPPCNPDSSPLSGTGKLPDLINLTPPDHDFHEVVF